MSALSRIRAILTADVVGYGRMNDEPRGPAARILDAIVRHVRLSEMSPIAAGWFWSDLPPRARLVHEVGLKASLGYRSQLSRWLHFLAWPFVMLAVALALLARNGSAVRHSYGVSRLRQLGQLLYFGFRRNVAPSDYYLLRLFRTDRRSGAYFVTQREMYGLHRRLQPRHDHIDIANDKARFERHCQAAGLPVPAAIARFGPGHEEWVGDGRRLPPVDLFRKPAGSSHGRNAQLWRYDRESGTWSHGRHCLDEAGFIEDCRGRDAIVQRALANHAEIRDLAPNGLATFRVTTLLFSNGPRAISAVLRLPVGKMSVDNFSAGGLIANVDIRTGYLGAAVSKEARHGEYRHHPDTNAVIEGRRIEAWPEIRNTALKAHETVPGLTSVGWDIALTEDGIVLIEANVGWGSNVVQLASGIGLADTEFADWVVEKTGRAT